MLKILKNNSLSSVTISSIGLTISPSSSVEIVPQNYSQLANQRTIDEIEPYISSGDIIINNGSTDLVPDVGIAHISEINGVEFSHTDITLLPGVGDFAAAFVEIDNVAAGHQMGINEIIYGQTRIDNLAGGDVGVQLHYAIDNDTADRWIQLEARIRTTTGHEDKVLNDVDTTITIGPIEVPTTPFLSTQTQFSIPAMYFSGGEHYILFQIKRVAATGKTAPVNDPVIWRYCKYYYKVNG